MRKKEKILKIPDWLKLDNAAIIYPSTLSKKYACMFRLTITLNDTVDKTILNNALLNIIDRFPSFCYELRQGFFWFYMKKNKLDPIIEEDYNNPMLRINFKKYNNYMFRVRYYDKRIAVEYFHALTDGMGGIKFISTLVGEYIKIKYNEKISYNDIVLNPNVKTSKKEYSDDFYKNARIDSKLEREKSAYHYKGNLESKDKINIITGIIPLDKIKELSQKNNCSITCFLASLMIEALQKIYYVDSRKRKKKYIKVSIPVNLRKYYDSKTVRNFSSYINVGIYTGYGHYSLEEIIKIVKNNMEINLTEKRLNAKFSANVKLSKNYAIRMMPMFIKKHILSLSEKILGDNYCTTTLSNLGLIKFPKEMERYINEVGFAIGNSRGKPGSVSCIGYKNNLYITFTRKIKESEFERLFFTELVKYNIPVLIESNRR